VLVEGEVEEETSHGIVASAGGPTGHPPTRDLPGTACAGPRLAARSRP
jgi:hypothetical protein